MKEGITRNPQSSARSHLKGRFQAIKEKSFVGERGDQTKGERGQ